MKYAAARRVEGIATGDTHGFVQGHESNQVWPVQPVEGSPVSRSRGSQVQSEAWSRAGARGQEGPLDHGFYLGSMEVIEGVLLSSDLDLIYTFKIVGKEDQRGALVFFC